MNNKVIIKKVFTAIFIFLLVAFILKSTIIGLLALEPKDEQTLETVRFASKINNEIVYLISSLIVIIYIIYSWPRKILRMNDILKIKYTHLYSNFTPQQQQQLDMLVDDKKLAFTQEYLKLKSPSFNQEIEDACKQEVSPPLPFFILYSKRIILCLLILFLLISGPATLSFVVEHLENEQVKISTKAVEGNSDHVITNVENGKNDIAQSDIYSEKEAVNIQQQTVDLEKQRVEALKNEIVMDQTFNIDGLPSIVLRCNNTANRYEINMFISKIQAQPQWLLVNCNTIYITNESSYYALGGASVGSVGTAKRLTNDILLLYNGGLLAITHELAHIWDFTHDMQSDSYELKGLFNKYAGTLKIGSVYTEYAASNPSEFFAEYAMAYVVFGAELQQSAPDLYNYYSNLFSL